jgi:hypothetical protein
VIDEAGITVTPVTLTANARSHQHQVVQQHQQDHHQQQQQQQQDSKLLQEENQQQRQQVSKQLQEKDNHQQHQKLQGVYLLPQQQYSVLIVLSLIQHQQQQQQQVGQPAVSAAAASLGVFGQFVMVTAVVDGNMVADLAGHAAAAAAGAAAGGPSNATSQPTTAAAAAAGAAGVLRHVGSNVSLVPWGLQQESYLGVDDSQQEQQEEDHVGLKADVTSDTLCKAAVMLCRKVSAAIVPSVSDIKSMLRPDARPFISSTLRQLFWSSNGSGPRGGFIPVPQDVQWPMFVIANKVSVSCLNTTFIL